MGLVKVIKGFIQPHSGGGGNRTGRVDPNEKFASKIGSNLKVFSTSPELQGLFKGYFGFDIGQLGNFSIQDFQRLARSAEEARQFEKYKDVILKNIQDYISGVVNFNQMVAQCAKDGAAGMQKIDQSTFDTWLVAQGYQQNVAKLSKKTQNQQQKFSRDLEDFNSYEDFTLEQYMQNAAYKMQRKRDEFMRKVAESKANDNEYDINAEWQRFALKEKSRTERDLSDLLTYGEIKHRNPDAGYQSETVPVEVQQNNGGMWRNVGKFFNGE
jgi:hypothetical protein